MIIGTAGHIDHGKTSLVRALTGVDTDRLKEEKARGISIELGFAYLPASNGSVIGFVDVPGHEKFVHTMVAGAAGVDFVLLVVAADDGIMPQTREHLAIIELLGLARGIVALTKCDSVEPSRVDQVRDDIENFLATSALTGAEIVSVSSITDSGIDDLRQKLFDASTQSHARSVEGVFRFAVDRSFTLPGAGTIVTGIVLSGAVSVGDHVVVSPSGIQARIRSIHAQNRVAERGVAGERCALNLAGNGVTKNAIARGDFVVATELHAPTSRIDASLVVLPSEIKSVTQWMPARLHHAASEVGARIVLLSEKPIVPGAKSPVQLVLEKPVAAAVGDRFVLRDTTGQRTIAGGAFLDLRPPARKRRTPERHAFLQAAAANHLEALTAFFDLPPYFVDLTSFARDRAISSDSIADFIKQLALEQISVANTIIAFSRQRFLQLVEGIRATLTAFHAANPDKPGDGIEVLRMAIKPRLPGPVFHAVLQRLATEGLVSLDGAWVGLASHKTRLADGDEKDWERIAPLLSGEHRFKPPSVSDLASMLALREANIRRLLKLLARLGKVDEVAPDHFFLRTTVTEMTSIAADIAGRTSTGEFTAAQFRDQLDNGRKTAIQVLEFFDRRGVTLRRGDLRRINANRLAQFSGKVVSDKIKAGT